MLFFFQAQLDHAFDPLEGAGSKMIRLSTGFLQPLIPIFLVQTEDAQTNLEGLLRMFPVFKYLLNHLIDFFPD